VGSRHCNSWFFIERKGINFSYIDIHENDIYFQQNCAEYLEAWAIVKAKKYNLYENWLIENPNQPTILFCKILEENDAKKFQTWTIF